MTTKISEGKSALSARSVKFVASFFLPFLSNDPKKVCSFISHWNLYRGEGIFILLLKLWE